MPPVYATTTSLDERMVGTNFDTATTALASEMLGDAQAEVNKYLSKRYDVSAFMSSAGSVPPIVSTWTYTLGEGYMYQRMSRGGKDAMERGQYFIDQVIKNLEKVAAYELDIVSTAGSVISDMSNTSYRLLSTTDSYKDTFAEDDPLNWKVDQNKLDDISDDRDDS